MAEYNVKIDSSELSVSLSRVGPQGSPGKNFSVEVVNADPTPDDGETGNIYYNQNNGKLWIRKEDSDGAASPWEQVTGPGAEIGIDSVAIDDGVPVDTGTEYTMTFTLNDTDNTELPPITFIVPSGGGTNGPHPLPENVVASASVRTFELNADSENTIITVTETTPGYYITEVTAIAGRGTIQTIPTISDTETTELSFGVDFDDTDLATAGTFSITTTVVGESDEGVGYSDDNRLTFTVAAPSLNWYAEAVTSEPVDLLDLTNRGVYEIDATATISSDTDSTIYFWIPHAGTNFEGNPVLLAGVGYLVIEEVDGVTVQTNNPDVIYQLYSGGTQRAGNSTTVTINGV